MELKYFKLEEFDSPDVPGSGSYMDPELLLMLDEARRISGGVPFRINSGWRSIERNRAAGGKEGSSHCIGKAVDVAASNSRERFVIVRSLIEAGMPRLGVSNSFVHADNDEAKAQNVMWTY